MKRNVALVACAASLVAGAPAPFPAPSPEPMHAVGGSRTSSSSLLSMFDDADLIAISDTLGKRDIAAALSPRHPAAAAAFDAALGNSSKKSLRFNLSKKRHETGRSTKRFTRRQAAGNGTADVDDESELLNYLDIRYIASINIAGQDLDVILDTGSTDTFVYSVHPEPFQGIPESQLPPLYSNTTGAANGAIDTGITYEAQYGGGNGITSTLGAVQLADVRLNGTDFSVSNLTFANLYQSTAATGASGLLGLGFPLNGIIWLEFIARYYNETGQAMPLEQSANYWPIVPLLYHEERISRNLFSVEVDRDSNTVTSTASSASLFDYTEGGTLTLGDFPEQLTEDQFLWTPVPYVAFTQQGQSRGLPRATGNRWTTPLEAIYFNGQRLTNTTQQSSLEDDGGIFYTLIDTGNPSTSMPRDVLSQITNAWAANPSNLVVDCDLPFEFILQFGGQNFTMAKEDFLVPSTEALDSANFGGSATSGCQFQAQPADPTPDEIGPGTSITYALGAPFLRNVISVFDYGDLNNAFQQPPRIGLYPRSQ